MNNNKEFKESFDNKYKNKYEYVRREFMEGTFKKDTHTIKCLKCNTLVKRKGSTLYNGGFSCKCQRKICEKYSVNYGKFEQKFIEKFNKIYGEKFEYLGGYKNGKVKCKCKVCGDVKERVKNELLQKDRNLACRKCGNNYKGSEYKTCTECLNKFIAFSKEQVLCRICKDKERKYKMKTNKRLREARAKNNGKIDRSISLEKLIKRDNGICKICKEKVDINDYLYNDKGHRITKENYPSIDHIIPLSKGGTHTWDNIQLAHFKCNTRKSNKV